MSLVKMIIDERNIYHAIKMLKSNKGSKTPGVNGETIDNIIANEDEIVKRIRKELSDKTYQPQQVKRVEYLKAMEKQDL